MIGVLVLFGAAIYLLLGLLVIVLVAKSTKGRIIGIIILALIPTWDVIIGYPTFWYLCKFKSGVKIYKTVENVEGFYAGEWDKRSTPRMPDKNYKYIDYQVKETGEFFRSYWLDDTTSEDCYKPKKKDEYKYKKSFHQEVPCFSVKLLLPEEVSRYEVHRFDEGEKILPFMQLKKYRRQKIADRHVSKILAEDVGFFWNRGWLRATLLNVGDSKGILCPYGIDSKTMRTDTLKPSKITKERGL